MAGMTLTNKVELAAALTDNYLQIRNAAERLAGRISDDDRRQRLNQIIGLRKARRELEAKLRRE
jgi:hypothetical protein